MALLSAAVLTDQAVVLRSVAVGPKVEGRTQIVSTSLGWFPARLVVTEAREVEGAGRRRIVERGELVCANEDVRPSDQLLVLPRGHVQGQEQRWRVSGRPVVASTRRATPAVVVPVERLREPDPADTVTP